MKNNNLDDILTDITSNYKNNNPYIIGITGAMGVGKSTFSIYLKNTLQNILQKDTIISIISTDSFLYDNSFLKQHELMKLKGFPQSFNQQMFYNFLIDIKNNQKTSYKLPIYSQIIKDIDKKNICNVKRSNIYIIEGINLFYPFDNMYPYLLLNMFILLHMQLCDIKKQCIKRFNLALDQHKKKPSNYFKNLNLRTQEDVNNYTNKLWENINKPFYEKYIEPNIHLTTHILNMKHQDNYI